MQLEFDDRPLAQPFSIEVLWNPIDDDFLPKPAAVFRQGVDFARAALDQSGSKLLIHCAAGAHRAPMMALALLCSLGWTLPEAVALVGAGRPAAECVDDYVVNVYARL